MSLVQDILKKASQGVATETATVSPGLYPGKLSELKVTKIGIGKNGNAYLMFNAAFELDSEMARQVLKRDKNPIYRTDMDNSTLLKGFFNMSEVGFTTDMNPGFWKFVGGMLESAGYASYNASEKQFDFSEALPILEHDIYNTEFEEYLENLNNTVLTGGDLPVESPDLNKAEIIPALLSKQLIENWNTVLNKLDVPVLVKIGKAESFKGSTYNYVDNVFFSKDFDALEPEVIR